VLVDTHCHLADSAYQDDLPQVLDRAWVAGVSRIIVIGECRASAARALALAAAEPRLSATAGVHPHHASEWSSETENWLRRILRDPRVVAVGEIGLDFHYDHSARADQRRAFEAQLVLAAEVGKPAVVHAREADDEVASILASHPTVTAVLHSFSSGMGLLRAGLVLRHYVSFSGMVTFKNWQLDEAILETPSDRLLLETDGPYLAPVPHRGKRNEPAYVARVAEQVASVRGVTVEDLVAETGDNARRVFQLSKNSNAANNS
jgi:TatD DNase family protein